MRWIPLDTVNGAREIFIDQWATLCGSGSPRTIKWTPVTFLQINSKYNRLCSERYTSTPLRAPSSTIRRFCRLSSFCFSLGENPSNTPEVGLGKSGISRGQIVPSGGRIPSSKYARVCSVKHREGTADAPCWRVCVNICDGIPRDDRLWRCWWRDVTVIW